MAILESQKVDYLWKKLGYGRTKTDVNAKKKAFNESIPSPLLLRGDKIWAQSDLIPATIPASTPSGGVVTVYSDPVETVADITASPNCAWKTNITDWIPPEIGATYLVKVYIHDSGDAANAIANGTQVLAAGSGNDDEWFFDYQSGVLCFIGVNLPNGIDFSGKSVYITGAVYSGAFGVGSSGVSTSTFGPTDSINTTGIITASSFVGDSATFNDINATNINVSGISTLTNLLEIRSDDAEPGRIDFYCEVNNLHRVRLKAPLHSEFSGNPDVVLPNISGDLLVGDTASPISQNMNTTGIITAASFSGDGSGLSGVVTSLIAGDNITITESGGDFTIDAEVFDPTSAVNFTDETDNILGNPDSGAIQIDGGLGIEKNTTIGGGLRVQGNSAFIGIATFHGGIVNLQGDVNLGDDSSDNISVGGDFVSGLRPDVSDSFDLGLLGQKWRNLFLSGYLSSDEIRNSTNTPSISLQTNGNVVVEESLTVNGDLLVTGTSTQVNTSQLEVEDRTIELGIVDGSIPTSTTTWDLGVLFNYHDGTSAKKSAVAWEQSRERFVFANDADDGGGIGVDNPQLVINDYATIEVGSIWINDCAGQSELVACSNGERTLNNITIDGGFF